MQVVQVSALPTLPMPPTPNSPAHLTNVAIGRTARQRHTPLSLADSCVVLSCNNYPDPKPQ